MGTEEPPPRLTTIYLGLEAAGRRQKSIFISLRD